MARSGVVLALFLAILAVILLIGEPWKTDASAVSYRGFLSFILAVTIGTLPLIAAFFWMAEVRTAQNKMTDGAFVALDRPVARGPTPPISPAFEGAPNSVEHLVLEAAARGDSTRDIARELRLPKVRVQRIIKESAIRREMDRKGPLPP